MKKLYSFSPSQLSGYQTPVSNSMDMVCEGILCESNSEIDDLEFEFDPTVKE